MWELDLDGKLLFRHWSSRGARGSNDPVPVEDDANDSLDELMQEIDRQMVDDSTHPEQRAEVPDPVVD